MKNLRKVIALAVTLAMVLSMFTVVNAVEPKNQSIQVNPVSGLSSDFIMGADVSMLKDIEDYGGKFYNDDGTQEDCLQILKDHGVNWVRLRIWNDPTTDANGYVGNDRVMIGSSPAPAGTPAGAGTCDEANTIALAKRAKALGMKVLLDFHYSDFWADPGKQTKPKAWKNLTGAALQDAVYNYTKDVLNHMKDEGVLPEMVQIGNENNNGMLWPEGNKANGYAGWIGLLNAGTKAVREVGGQNTKIMIHLANGGDNTMYRNAFDRFTDFSKATGYVAAADKYNEGKTAVDFDVIGLSYYAFWHGPLSTFKANITDLGTRYGKEIAIAEIGYGFTFDNNDSQSNAFAEGADELGGYQASVQGQAQYIRDIIEAVSQVKDNEGNNKGIGVFYWEPEWIPVKDAQGNTLVGWITGGGNDSENRALFDFEGHALKSLDVFEDVRKSVSELPGGTIYSATITRLRPIAATVTVAETPSLPATVKADFSDGTIRNVPVTWDAINPADMNKLHTFTLQGIVAGTTEKAVLTVTVIGKKNFVTNPGFEAGNTSGWQVIEDSPNDVQTGYESSPGNNAYTGSGVFTYYVSPNDTGFTLQQTITGLPNGTYSLRVVSHGGEFGTVERYLFAKDYGGQEKRVSITNTGWQQWKFPEIKNITVTNGQCTIGVRVETAGVGTWGKLDDFELYPDLSAANLILPAAITSGSEFTARLRYSKLIYNAYAQDITIEYDSNKLDFVGAEGADSGTIVTNTDTSTPGTVRVLTSTTATGGLSWNADALKLTFAAKTGVSVSTSDITITKAQLGTAPDGSVKEPAGLNTLIESPTPMLGGSVAISGSAKFGQTLSANLSGLTNNSGILSYSWKRGTAVIGTNSTYTVEEGDIGKSITVTVTGDGTNAQGSVTSAAVVPAKADGPSVPMAPNLLSKTSTSITLNTIAGAEYSKDNGAIWQDSPTFTGLNASTQYTFIARIKETTTHLASANSASVNIITDAVSSGSGSSSSGSGTTPAPVTPPVVTPTEGSKPVKVEVPAPVVNGGTAKVTVNPAAISKALEAAQPDAGGVKTVVIPVARLEGQTSYEASLPAANLTAGTNTQRIQIETDVGILTAPANMLTATDIAGAQNISLSIARMDTTSLDASVKEQIGDRPVLELNVKSDGRTISWNNPEAPVTVSVPYTPTAEELKDPDHIVIWYIDGSGKANAVPNARYDAASGRVVFTTTHFSKYAVAYVKKTFGDLNHADWAREEIEVLASKGVTSGTSQTTFSPEKNVTRADYLVMLVRALGLSAKVDGNFDDVKETDYFYEAVGIAKKLGIATGSGNNKFNPQAEISRQDMMVLTSRALKATKKLSSTGVTGDLNAFNDKSLVSGYAVDSVAALVKAGIVNGRNGMIAPKDNITRAETAVIIYRASKK
ncbi:MAG: glycosyl hydrolase 53 family protein [Clostridia bacterium]|nr:glycosyl hydrolase 53 family protein [Clostridia bacterium]